MFKKIRLIRIVILVFVLAMLDIPCVYASKVNYPLTVVLDPGHGGEENGAEYYGAKEKDINLKIAEYVKTGLEEFDNVQVVLTRDGDYAVGLKERADIAVRSHGDIFISLHCNASESHQKRGASVYISTGEANRKELKDFADYFLGEFEDIGLENAGTFARVTQKGRMREDGSFDDYYGVLRHSYNNGVPALIVEHCYMDSPYDWDYLNNEEGVKRLAEADVNAIRAYYHLSSGKIDEYAGKHAQMYGATTEAIRLNYFEAPILNGIRLKEYDGNSPGVAIYSVDIEDGIGVNLIYLIYKNSVDDSITIPLEINEEIRTGTYELTGYVPYNVDIQNMTLQYVGMYNIAGFDAGYNYHNNKFVGFGKCEWLNSFEYMGEADINITGKGSISKVYMQKLNEGIWRYLRKCPPTIPCWY